MKPIAPSVPLTQPSLVPPSAEQSHTSQPIPPDHHHYLGAKRGRYLPGLEFDSRVGVSRLQAYPRLARASSALGRQLFKNPVPFRPSRCPSIKVCSLCGMLHVSLGGFCGPDF